jgi:Protein of unknown function (DUF3892)
VDGGGNASDERTAGVNIEWHGARISCIRRDLGDCDRPIDAVGEIHPGGWRWRLTLAEAIAEVDAGQPLYVERPDGDRVAVVVAPSPWGSGHLKTVADGDVPNNLLALPERPP